jgi:hypothetical protein
MSSSGTRPSFVFRKQLFSISNRLTNADVKNLKFLCTDLLTRRVVEGVTTGSELFSALEDVNRLSPTNLDFLQMILDSVSKGHLVKELEEALANPTSHESGGLYETATSGPPSLDPADPLTIKFNSFLVSLGSELPERDLKHAAYFFQSCKVTGLSAQEVQRLRDPAELFQILKQEKIISPTDLGEMRRVMEAIGRIDLRDKISEYMDSVSSVSDGSDQSGGGGVYRGRQFVLDSSRDSLSSNFSFESSEGKVVGDSRPVNLPRQPEQQQSGRFKSGLTDSARAHPVSEQGAGQSSRMLVAGGNTHRRVTSMEQQAASVGQPEGRVAQSVGGAVGKLVGLQTGRSVNHAVDGSELPRRTHTQQLQLERNEAVERVLQLENQLEHERLHVENSREIVEELRRKNEEVGGLRQQVERLDGQLQRGEDAEMYHMNAVPPHGKAIVIVNNTFTPNPELVLRPRSGAMRDMFLFRQTFEHLGYTVEAHSNLTGVQMHQVIAEVAAENHDAHDSFVCCISTHGDDEKVYGADSIGVKRVELIQTVKQSATLLEKPKMFFLQACRTKSSSTPTTENLTHYQPDAPKQDADIFVANATTPNSASYRDPSTGSWFVSTLHRVFTSPARHNATLSALMHEVNREVCDAHGVIREGDPHRLVAGSSEARQCAEITSSFRYGLRFKFSSQ